MLTAETIQAVHGNRSDDSWRSIRRTLRNHYKRRTGQLPTADTLQDLLIAFLGRTQDSSALADDQFGRTISRTVGDVICRKVKADAAHSAELDAAQTYAQLKQDGIHLKTHVKTRSHNGRSYGEQAALECIWNRLELESRGVIEIFRPEVTDTRFA